MYRGTFTALVTPFTPDNRVDEDAFMITLKRLDLDTRANDSLLWSSTDRHMTTLLGEIYNEAHTIAALSGHVTLHRPNQNLETSQIVYRHFRIQSPTRTASLFEALALAQ